MTTVSWNKAQKRAMKLARGDYQSDVVAGYADLSGADLRGKARHWSAVYYCSRESLLNRLYRDPAVPIATGTGRNGKRKLVFGTWAVDRVRALNRARTSLRKFATSCGDPREVSATFRYLNEATEAVIKAALRGGCRKAVERQVALTLTRVEFHFGGQE